MKPHIVHDLPATREAIGKAFGQKIAELYVPNPLISLYAVALRFPDVKVIVSGEIRRALRKVESASGPVLIVAHDLTTEARRVVVEARCDLMTKQEFGWTDESYTEIRQKY
ncbi:MAG TPA: hypothetical protein PKA55_05565 [Rhodoblastus sp.]|nr:hypothetical protein [Rhodoblastus sp.]